MASGFQWKVNVKVNTDLFWICERLNSQIQQLGGLNGRDGGLHRKPLPSPRLEKQGRWGMITERKVTRREMSYDQMFELMV